MIVVGRRIEYLATSKDCCSSSGGYCNQYAAAMQLEGPASQQLHWL